MNRLDISIALQQLGATNMTLGSKQIQELDHKGYTIMHGVMNREWLESLRERFETLSADERQFAGAEVHQEEGARRLADLVNKGQIFDKVYTHPMVLAAVHHILNRDFKLSSLNARDALPGQGHQRLHPDWSTDYEGIFHVCNSIWLLDDFTEKNGCTRLVPGTHKGKHPDNTQQDADAPHPQEELLTAPAGTVAVFNSQTWHGGTKNRTNGKRRALHCYFTAREHKQQLNQREYMRHETWKRISPAARYILDVDVG